MDDCTFTAFGDELSKIAGLASWLTNAARKAQLRANYHFSTRAGPERWDKFLNNVSDPSYLLALADNPKADPKLLQHAEALHELIHGKTVGKVYSARLPGRSYEIKDLGGGKLGCTCPDWRFVGTVRPGYECKHILAYKAGKVKVED